MLVATLTMGPRIAIVLLAGVATGIANGIAGGGTFISFPTLLAVGIPSLQADVSTSVGVTPSNLGGILEFRGELSGKKKLLASLIPSCVLGTTLGTILLFAFPASTFSRVVPWLIGGGTTLFAFSPLITRRLAHIDTDHPGRRRTLFVGIFCIAVYGGYFGAGLGIMLIAVMAITLPYSLHEIQGLRSVLASIITVFASIIFLVRGHLAVQAVLVLLVGTLIGGMIGSWLIRRLHPTVVRTMIVLIGIFTTVRLAWTSA